MAPTRRHGSRAGETGRSLLTTNSASHRWWLSAAYAGSPLLGHHRSPEGHRPRTRRDLSRAPQKRCTCSSTPGRRSHLLVYDYRLDDLGPPRRLHPDQRHDPALRRQPRTSIGTSASYIESRIKADIEPTRGRDLMRYACVGSRGAPPEGRWLCLGLRAARRRHLAVSRAATTATSAPLSSAA